MICWYESFALSSAEDLIAESYKSTNPAITFIPTHNTTFNPPEQ